MSYTTCTISHFIPTLTFTKVCFSSYVNIWCSSSVQSYYIDTRYIEQKYCRPFHYIEKLATSRVENSKFSVQREMAVELKLQSKN